MSQKVREVWLEFGLVLESEKTNRLLRRNPSCVISIL